MGWYKKADHKDEIRGLELQLKSLEERKTFLPKQIDALKTELNNITKMIDATKGQLRALKSMK